MTGLHKEILSEGLGRCAETEGTTRKKAMYCNEMHWWNSDIQNLILNKPRMAVLFFCTLLPNLCVWNIFVKNR
jgi:hypothetical protein